MTVRFEIRIADPDDAASVSALLEASYPTLMRASYDADVLAAALPKMTKANPALLASGTYYLARTGNDVAVGCGGWSHARPGGGDSEAGLAHLRHFATHPDWTGRGVGRALYRRCAETARVAGVRRFECYSSLNAEGFYAALGFATVRVSEIPMGDGITIPNVIMRREI